MKQHLIYCLFFLYISFTFIHTRILYECNFDNAIITNSCFTGSNMFMIVSKGIGKASKDTPVAPLSDVTSSVKLTSNGQKCKLPYKVKTFSWFMYFCNEGFCPTQANQNTACQPGQFGYFEFWANEYKVSFLLNTPSTGINGVNAQCLIYYYYMTNIPTMVDKITVRKLETVTGTTIIDTVTNSPINGWNERRVSFSASRSGYKIYFDLERVSGPIIAQSYVAVDEISIHQDDCSRVTTILSTTVKTTKSPLITSTVSTSVTTTSVTSTTTHSTTTTVSTTIQDTFSTILPSIESTISTTSTTMAESTVTTPSMTTQIIETTSITTQSSIIMTSIIHVTTTVSISLSTLSVSKSSDSLSTEQNTRTHPMISTTRTTQSVTTIGHDNDKNSSDKTLVLALAISIPSLLIVIVASIGIWIKTSTSTGAGVLGSIARPFTNLGKKNEFSKLVEMDEMTDNYQF